MRAIERALRSLGLDRRCRGFCRKCDLGIQGRFDSAGEESRRSFVEAVASCNGADFDDPSPLLGLVLLLNQSEFEQFITKIAQRAPFDHSLAWGNHTPLLQQPLRLVR